VTDRSIDRSVGRPIEGLLVVDKPAGPTSHDVVARARRLLGEKRIGHTGTLDPFATGVLPLVIGKATRLANLLSATQKDYEALVRLGATSDTYDATGTIAAATSRPIVDVAAVEAVLSSFRGTFEQMPPPYSAKKVGGVRAYKLARQQKPTQLSPVPVTVHALDLLGLGDDTIRLRVRTSPGFYVRSLAHDIGARLGCGGYLDALRRTQSARFTLDDATPLEDLERDPEGARGRLVPLDRLVPELPAVRVTDPGAERVAHGNFLRPSDLAEVKMGTLAFSGPRQVENLRVPFSDPADPSSDSADPWTGPVRVIDARGRLLAIAQAGADGLLRPSIVLV
jgi:tRNA pseudouridine55 synthase